MVISINAETVSKAKEIMLLVNPNAKVTYTFNKCGTRYCNGKSISDCQDMVDKIDKYFMEQKNKEAAQAAHKIPLFVFVSLTFEELKTFVSLWLKHKTI